MDPQELTRRLAQANKARRAGVSPLEIDARLQEVIGLTYSQLVVAVKSSPREEATPAITAVELMRQGVRGATLGLSPLLLDAETRHRANTESEAFRRAHPAASTIARLYGGGVTAAATAGAGMANLGARQTAGAAGAAAGVPVAGGASPATGLLGRLGIGAGAGAAYGAAEAIGESPTPSEIPSRLGRIVPLAAAGGLAATGGGMLLTEGLPFVARSIGNILFAGVGSKERVGRAVATAASRVLERLTAGRERAGAGTRLADDVRALTGFRRPASVAAEAAQSRLSARGRDLYGPIEQAHPFIDVDDKLAALLNNPDVGTIWNRVRPVTGKAAAVNPGDQVSFAHIQALRQQLIKARGDALRASRAGGASQPAVATLYGRARSELDEILDATIPEFRAANRGFAQSARTVEGFGLGARALKQNLRADAIDIQMRKLADAAGDEAGAALEAYRYGMADAFVTRLLSAKEAGGIAKGILTMSATQKAAMRTVFKTAENFERFMSRVVSEAVGETPAVASAAVSSIIPAAAYAAPRLPAFLQGAQSPSADEVAPADVTNTPQTMAPALGPQGADSLSRLLRLKQLATTF